MLFSERPLFFTVCINIFTLFKSDQELKRDASEGLSRVASHVEMQSPEGSVLSFMLMPCFLRAKFQNAHTEQLDNSLEVGPQFQQAQKL